MKEKKEINMANMENITIRDAMIETLILYFNEDISILSKQINNLIKAQKEKNLDKVMLDKDVSFLTGRRNMCHNFISFLKREFSDEYVENENKKTISLGGKQRACQLYKPPEEEDENRRAISLGGEQRTTEDEGSSTENLSESKD